MSDDQISGLLASIGYEKILSFMDYDDIAKNMQNSEKADLVSELIEHAEISDVIFHFD
jgi:hypothetical protein